MLLIKSFEMKLNSKYRTEKLKAKDRDIQKTKIQNHENLVLQKYRKCRLI